MTLPATALALVAASLTATFVAAAVDIVPAAAATPTMYVTNGTGNTITSYPATATGNAAPASTVSSTYPSIKGPQSYTFDSAGDAWITDNSNNTVTELASASLASSGIPYAVKTIYANGTSLDFPFTPRFDSSGNLWVTNSAVNTIAEFTAAQLSACVNTCNPTPNTTITANLGSLNLPRGIVFDSSGNLWVMATTTTVAEYTAAQLSACVPTCSSTPHVTISTNGVSLSTPNESTFDSSGNLWVTNQTGGSPGTVVEFTPSQLASSGSPTPTITISATGTSLDGPQGDQFDGSGNMWVTNFTNSTVVEFLSTQITASGSPTPHVVISASGSSLSGIGAAHLDSSGNLWVVNNTPNSFVEFTAAQLSACVPTCSSTPNVTISAAAASLQTPIGGDLDSTGNLWVFNRGGNSIVEYSPAQLSAGGALAPATTVLANTGSLNAPDAGAFDSSGNLWVVDNGNNTVVEFTHAQLLAGGPQAANTTISATGGSLNAPIGDAMDSSGDLWVTNGTANTLVEFTHAQLLAGGAQAATITISATGGSLNAPSWLSFDSSGDLWVTNVTGNTLVEFTHAQLLAGGAQAATITISATGGGSLNTAYGESIDRSGNLWVTNNGNNSVVAFTPTQLSATGSPVPNTTISGAATGLSGPQGIAVYTPPPPPPPPQTPTTTSLAVSPNPATAGQPVSLTATVSGAGSSPGGSVTFYDGTSALGLQLLSGDTATLTISTLGSGTHSVTATYSGFGSTTSSTGGPVSLVVGSPPPPVSIVTTSLAGATTGTSYSATLAATGGTAPYTWSVSTGTLPSGLTLSPAGDLTGTPTTTGTTTFTVSVSDSSTPALSATQSLVLAVAGSSSGTCPVGDTGTPPNCTPSSTCPVGDTGTPPNCTAPAASGPGYIVNTPTGAVSAFGSVANNGSLTSSGTAPVAPIVGNALTADSKGYWLVGSDGGVFTFGDASFFGSEGGTALNSAVVGITGTSNSEGYWLIAADGGVFTFGDAGFFGSEGGIALNAPVVGLAATPDGKGYWEVASDGGIFTFGDASFFGSQGAARLASPVAGMARTTDGKGYWMVSANGTVTAFGDAGSFGGANNIVLNKPITSIIPTADSNGYWLIGADGGVFNFGDAPFDGSGAPAGG